VNDEAEISLIRHHVYSQAATLKSAECELNVFERRLRGGDGPPYWLPELLVHGSFDILDGTPVALYRAAAEPRSLWLQIGRQRFEIDGSAQSRFSPTFEEDEEPALESAELARRFELWRDGSLIASHDYVLNDREKRLYYGSDLFPAWPDEEENYDLLLLAHRIIGKGAWSTAFEKPLPA